MIASPGPQNPALGLSGELDLYDPGCNDPYCSLAPGHDGPHSHIRGCKCRSCTGKRNRRAGKRAQNRAFRSVGGVELFPGQISEEERWSAFPWAPGFRWEVKSGAQVPAWVTSAIRQVEAMTPDARPGLIIKPKGSTTLYALVRLTDLADEMKGA